MIHGYTPALCPANPDEVSQLLPQCSIHLQSSSYEAHCLFKPCPITQEIQPALGQSPYFQGKNSLKVKVRDQAKIPVCCCERGFSTKWLLYGDRDPIKSPSTPLAVACDAAHTHTHTHKHTHTHYQPYFHDYEQSKAYVSLPHVLYNGGLGERNKESLCCMYILGNSETAVFLTFKATCVL